MSLNRQYILLIDVIKNYSYKLNSFNEESFQFKYDVNTWSSAEVYAHIITANKLSLKGMLKAQLGEATEDSSPLSWSARLIIFTGRIPKGRKVPELFIKRTPKFNSITEAKNALDELEYELNNLWDNRNLWSKTQKIKHPALGLLNNNQWMKFMFIHSKHHLKQLKRIKQKMDV